MSRIRLLNIARDFSDGRQIRRVLFPTDLEFAPGELTVLSGPSGTLVLRSPIEGFLYKFDVRLGEQLNPQDYQRIVIGKSEKQVRLFLESFWMDKVCVGNLFMVRDAETLRDVGVGKVVSISNYVGARDFRTDDSLERLDTKYAQAVLKLEEATSITIGKIVLCERQQSEDREIIP